MLVALVKTNAIKTLTLCYVFMMHTCITRDINFENNCTEAWLERLTWFIRYHGCFNEYVLVDIVTCNVLLNDIKLERKR